MSFHTLNFGQLKDEVEHAIGGVPDSRTDSARIVNGAIEFLCQQHAWEWRQKIGTLDFVNGEGEIDLPEDFSELIDITGKSVKNTSIKKATLKLVNRVRVYGLSTSNISLVYAIGMGEQGTSSTGGSPPYTFSSTVTAADPTAGKLRFDTATVASISKIFVSETDSGAVSRASFLAGIDASTDLMVVNLTTPSAFRVFQFEGLTDNGTWDTIDVSYKASSGNFANNDSVALVWIKNAGGSAAPRRQMVLAPIPTSDEEDALYITYRKLLPALEVNTDVPAIPLGFHELLRVLCRAMAVSSQVQQAGHDWQLFNSMLPNYIAADTFSSGQLEGQLRNVLDGGDSGIFRTAPHTEITFPQEF